jgi:hypothetical protein
MIREGHYLTLVDVTRTLVEIGKWCEVSQDGEEVGRSMFDMRRHALLDFFRLDGDVHVHLLK